MGNILFTDLTLSTKGNARHVIDINRYLLNNTSEDSYY